MKTTVLTAGGGFLTGLLLLATSAMAQYGGGTGDPNDPFQIWTPEQMNTIGAREADWDKSFLLMSDLDMSGITGTQYHVIGNNERFTGTFDGGGHVIRNLNFSGMGLFGYTSNATIANLNLENFQITAKSTYAGSLAGSQTNGKIINCSASGLLNATGLDIGGLVGHSNGLISDCHSSGAVTVINRSQSCRGPEVWWASNHTVPLSEAPVPPA